MDAICFVFGVSAKHLRGDKLKDLVWRVAGKAGGAAARAAKSASVTVVYVTDEGEVAGRPRGAEVRFSRVVTPAGASQYRIDGKEQSWDAYSAALEAINIVTKARNFLVFQVRGGAGLRRRRVMRAALSVGREEGPRAPPRPGVGSPS